MPKEKTPEEVYDDLETQGMYEEAHLDKDEVQKTLSMALEDYEFAKKLREMPNHPSPIDPHVDPNAYKHPFSPKNS